VAACRLAGASFSVCPWLAAPISGHFAISHPFENQNIGWPSISWESYLTRLPVAYWDKDEIQAADFSGFPRILTTF
jgi:hypothetical protein